MTLKYAPSVVGDGVRTLRELIHACPRAGNLPTFTCQDIPTN